MDKKFEFNQALSALVEYATVQGNHITTDDVKTYFKDTLNDPSMYAPVYSYLKERGIILDDLDHDNNTDITYGSSKQDGSPETEKKNCGFASESEEALKFFEMYKDDIDSISVSANSTCDIESLITASLAGDKNASNQLITCHLPLVMEIVESIESCPVRKSDLIQEGNLGLINGVMEYDGNSDFTDFITTKINEAIDLAIQTEIGSSRISEHIVERANSLSDASTKLAEELGREATLEELCNYLSLSEEEVRDVMKISLDAMTIPDMGQ